MNYKVIIDPFRGGTDVGVVNGSLVEKDYNLELSNYIYNKLKSIGFPVSITRSSDISLSNDERISKINSLYDMGSNVIVISNRLNSGSDSGIEINYALRNSSTLASRIASYFEEEGFIVNKYYQLRSEGDTINDADIIIRETNPNQTLIIYYGYIGNSLDKQSLEKNLEKYGDAVVNAIVSYTNFTLLDTFYTVKKGDSLYAIAKKYNTSVEKIKSLNNLATNTLMIGQKLILPTSDNSNTYIVKKGDSLYAIAKANSTTVSEIKRLNNLTSNLLNVGQVLTLPSDDYINYTVKEGDSLYAIARANNTSVDEIKRLNKLTSNLLSIGQVIKIPS